MINMPRLPNVNPEKAIRDDAEPVSESCCSSIKLALGGRPMVLPIVAGIMDIANIRGSKCPTLSISTPDRMTALKQAMIMVRRLNHVDSRI